MDLKLTARTQSLHTFHPPEVSSNNRHTSHTQLPFMQQLTAKITPLVKQLTDSSQSTQGLDAIQSSLSFGLAPENMRHIRSLGNGCFGSVDLFQLSDTDHYVAQKTIKKACDPKKLAQQTRSFERETGALKKLRQRSNPLVLQMISCSEDSRSFYIITPFIKGNNLLSIVNQNVTAHTSLT